MSDDAQGPAQVPQMWREYIIRLPKQLADALDKGLSLQKEMEDREIENSEYWAWLLMLGLNEVAKQNALAQENEQRVVSAVGQQVTQPKMPKVTRGLGGSWDVTL